MSTQIAVRLPDEMVRFVDHLVTATKISCLGQEGTADGDSSLIAVEPERRRIRQPPDRTPDSQTGTGHLAWDGLTC